MCIVCQQTIKLKYYAYFSPIFFLKISHCVVCCSRDWRFIVKTSFNVDFNFKFSAAQLFKIKNACYLSIRISCNSLCDSGVCEGVDQEVRGPTFIFSFIKVMKQRMFGHIMPNYTMLITKPSWAGPEGEGQGVRTPPP